jgi:hypothetical protein
MSGAPGYANAVPWLSVFSSRPEAEVLLLRLRKRAHKATPSIHQAKDARGSSMRLIQIKQAVRKGGTVNVPPLLGKEQGCTITKKHGTQISPTIYKHQVSHHLLPFIKMRKLDSVCLGQRTQVTLCARCLTPPKCDGIRMRGVGNLLPQIIKAYRF